MSTNLSFSEIEAGPAVFSCVWSTVSLLNFYLSTINLLRCVKRLNICEVLLFWPGDVLHLWKLPGPEKYQQLWALRVQRGAQSMATHMSVCVCACLCAESTSRVREEYRHGWKAQALNCLSLLFALTLSGDLKLSITNRYQAATQPLQELYARLETQLETAMARFKGESCVSASVRLTSFRFGTDQKVLPQRKYGLYLNTAPKANLSPASTGRNSSGRVKLQILLVSKWVDNLSFQLTCSGPECQILKELNKSKSFEEVLKLATRKHPPVLCGVSKWTVPLGHASLKY